MTRGRDAGVPQTRANTNRYSDRTTLNPSYPESSKRFVASFGSAVGVTPETAIRTYGPMARRIAREFFLPGSEREDVEQEAYIGLLGAVRSYRPETGTPFRPFAAMCVRRWLMTCVSAANRDKRALNETEAFDSEDTRAGVPELAELRAELHRVVSSLQRLSPLEARCVVLLALGFSYAEIDAAIGSHFKGTDNAIQRARKKLAA